MICPKYAKNIKIDEDENSSFALCPVDSRAKSLGASIRVADFRD